MFGNVIPTLLVVKPRHGTLTLSVKVTGPQDTMTVGQCCPLGVDSIAGGKPGEDARGDAEFRGCTVATSASSSQSPLSRRLGWPLSLPGDTLGEGAREAVGSL